MKTLSNLSELWQTYFLSSPAIDGVDSWTIVFMVPDGEKLLLSLANPFDETDEEVFIENVSAEDQQLFLKHYKQRFWEQLDKRFGLFKPETDSVLTEYPNWTEFYEAWLNDDPKLLQLNFPLLFDYPTDLQYQAMKLKDADYAGYRRLQVVLYQYRKNRFIKVFIKDVDDATMMQIKQQLGQFYKKALPQLMHSSKGVAV